MAYSSPSFPISGADCNIFLSSPFFVGRDVSGLGCRVVLTRVVTRLSLVGQIASMFGLVFNHFSVSSAPANPLLVRRVGITCMHCTESRYEPQSCQLLASFSVSGKISTDWSTLQCMVSNFCHLFAIFFRFECVHKRLVIELPHLTKTDVDHIAQNRMERRS